MLANVIIYLYGKFRRGYSGKVKQKMNIPVVGKPHFINAFKECSLAMETPIQMTSCSLQLAGRMLQIK